MQRRVRVSAKEGPSEPSGHPWPPHHSPQRSGSGTPGQAYPIANRDAIPALPAAGLLNEAAARRGGWNRVTDPALLRGRSILISTWATRFQAGGGTTSACARRSARPNLNPASHASVSLIPTPTSFRFRRRFTLHRSALYRHHPASPPSSHLIPFRPPSGSTERRVAFPTRPPTRFAFLLRLTLDPHRRFVRILPA